jgi:plastocyanin
VDSDMGRARAMRRWPLILVAALIALSVTAFAGACGGDDDEGEETTAETSAETVDVTAADYSFDLSTTPTADTKEITFENVGKEDHELIFAKINEGYTLQDAIKAEGRKGTAELLGRAVAKPGGQGKPLKVSGLKPGDYAMVCAFRTKDGKPHYSLGQQEEFVIE